MPKKSMELLTESMFYVLMALQTGPMCGIDAAEFIERRTKGRVQLGPAPRGAGPPAAVHHGRGSAGGGMSR